MNKKIIILVSGLAACSLLTGCARNISPNTYTTAEIGVVSKVKKGVVIGKRTVTLNNSSGAGALAGTAAGAAAGSMIGGTDAANVVGAVGGAVVGGVVGNAVDKSMHTNQGYEYIIKLDNGQSISVVQSKDVEFALKQHVLVIYGAMTRLVADETVSVSAPTHAKK